MDDQRALAVWAADCAERVLPLFEKAYPRDERPRQAIEACRAWIRTGEFKMATIRAAALAVHAAARAAVENDAACFAARAAGQAVATAHVPQHAYGAAYYALKALATTAAIYANEEREWQAQQLPESLREEVMSRILIQKAGRGIAIKIRKGDGF